MEGVTGIEKADDGREAPRKLSPDPPPAHRYLLVLPGDEARQRKAPRGLDDGSRRRTEREEKRKPKKLTWEVSKGLLLCTGGRGIGYTGAI